jgi:tripartite-type tricarboxylate transporter receptor subunit TctC
MRCARGSGGARRKLGSAFAHFVRALAFVAFASLALPGAAHAEFPERQITLVVGASAGGGVDAAARLIAKSFAESLHQTVVVENRPGAYSRIAYAAVAKAPADGHTLLIATATAAIDIAIDPDASPNAMRDFVPVATLATTDIVLVVSASLPVQNVDELIAYARASPGSLNFSTPGAHTIYHLEGELFKSRTDVDIVHVPYKGLMQALSGLLSGDVQMTFSSLAAALPFIKAGSVRALAVASAERSPLVPDVPTMTESGVDGVDSTAWYGVLAPVGTPDSAIRTLAAAVRSASRSPEYRQALLDMGALPFVTTPGDFAQMLRAEVVKWSELVKRAHLSTR